MTGEVLLPRPRRRLPIAAVLASAVYAAGLAAVLLWPDHIDGRHGQRVAWLLDLVATLGVPRATTYSVLEAGANVALFVPAGVILAVVAGGRWRWWIPVIGAAVSATAEIVQWGLLPDRTADLRDVVTDTTGTVLGALLVIVVTRVRLRRSGRRSRAARG